MELPKHIQLRWNLCKALIRAAQYFHKSSYWIELIKEENQLSADIKKHFLQACLVNIRMKYVKY